MDRKRLPTTPSGSELLSRQVLPPLGVPGPPPQYESWAAVNIPTKLHTATRLAIAFFLLFTLILVFVPWTQTITAQGKLSAYSLAERPQEVHAPIEGRIMT
ncbi:MAG: hypothetical protein MRJ67_17120 [Nitrospirales bacterium]|nr:hypothetical protein [Nitrospirales bacterium]